MDEVRRHRILIGVTGSVASIKLVQLSKLLSQVGEVKVVTTKAAQHFFKKEELEQHVAEVLEDADEWSSWKAIGDTVLHIALRQWADVLVIAPLSANTLAKLAGGMCDNLLTCIVRAWDFSKPCLVAPAMNTFMWQSPFTEKHLAALRELGVLIIPPVSKTLACGDVGVGAMACPETINNAVVTALDEKGQRRLSS